MDERVITGLSAFGEIWAGGMLRGLSQGTLFVLAVWALCRLFPRWPAAARAGLWWLACAKLLIGLACAVPLALPVLPPASRPPAPAPLRRAIPAASTPLPLRHPTAIGPTATAAPPPTAEEPARRPFPLAGLLLACWLVGLGWRLAGLAREWRGVRQLVRAARPVADGGIQEEAVRLAAALRLRRLPRLLEAPGVPGPMVVGLLRPAVLLPDGDAAPLSAEEVRMALAHELAHVRRRDLWWSLPPALARWLFYFYPLAALACQEWMTAREAACDAAALRATGAAPADYGRLLLKLAARNSGQLLPALGATAGFRSLKRRLIMLQTVPRSPRAWGGLITLAAAGALAALPWRLTARAAPAPPAPSPAAADQEAKLAACERQLAEIGRALAAYRRDHGELPPHLTDLFPRYVSDLKLFHCPADPTGGSPRRADDYDDEIAPPPDPRPISYAYYMSTQSARVWFGGLGVRPPGTDKSWRGQMLALREQYGDRVPVVRCWHHARTVREVYMQPLVPSLSLEGAVYRSTGNWQADPQTLAVVVERMERDMAHGAAYFAQRWNLGAMGEFFGYDKPIPTLRDRLRALAARLERLPAEAASAAERRTSDRSAQLSVDLPAAIGGLYSLAGDTDRAIAAYQMVIDRMRPATPIYQIGEIAAARCLPALYDKKGQHERSIAVYQRVIQKDPRKSDWYVAMADEYDALGQHEKALALRRKWDPSGLLRDKPAPEFDMGDQAGRSVDLAKLRGRVVVLFFWYNAYPRQAETARQLDALQRRYGHRGLTVVCLARLMDMGAAASQIGKNHSYPVLLGADAIYQKYGVRDSSAMDIVDRQGTLVRQYLGYGMDPGEERWLEHETRKMLGLETAPGD